MQNSLERLFEGLAASLREVIAPASTDAYARGQALAAAEIVENLATRVEWKAERLRDETARIRPLLDQAVASAHASELPLTRRLLAHSAEHDPLEDRNRHVAALAEVAEWALDRRASADLRRVVAEQLAAQARLMRGGMYRDEPW
jgi:hypothetical protein